MLRRDFIVGASTALLGLSSHSTWAQDSNEIEAVDPLPPLPQELTNYAGEPPAKYVESVAVGTGKPSPAEIAVAYDLLVGSPYNCRPLDVARYFRDVGQGGHGAEISKFAREWPRTANPVIFHFFSATDSKPEGDTTAWCAAFMNWCIMRSHASAKDEIGKSPGKYSKSGKAFDVNNFEKFATRNASSGSFRCWKSISNPKEGDIVVLADKGTQGLTSVCLGHGHVTMYLKKTDRDNWIEVLGGNQVLTGSGGAVTRANLFVGSGSRFLKYVSSMKKLET